VRFYAYLHYMGEAAGLGLWQAYNGPGLDNFEEKKRTGPNNQWAGPGHDFSGHALGSIKNNLTTNTPQYK